MDFNNKTSLKVPSFLIEYAYFTLLVYLMFGGAWGVTVPLVGAGALAGLALLCLMLFGQSSIIALKPITLALGCAISSLIIQLGFHQETLGHQNVRSLVTWALSLIVIQSLVLRKRFLHHFAFVSFLLGCGTLPFLETYVSTDETIRMGVSHEVGLANPNYFGMWFGFCAVYFLVVGLETRNYLIRIASWSLGLLSLYMVTITVSRGPLLGVAIAAVFAFQKVLKRSFLPILVCFCLMWVVFMSGIFDAVIGYYLSRSAEKSGRSELWAWGFAGFLDSWWAGVGFSNSELTVGSTTFGPHNSFLFIGLSSGIIPLAFYTAYLTQACRGAIRARDQKTPDSPYKLPLVSFAMLALMVSDGVFMSPWHMVVFSMVLGTANVDKKHRKVFNKTPPNSLATKSSESSFA